MLSNFLNVNSWRIIFSSGTLFSAGYVHWLQDPQMNTEAIIIAVTGTLAVLVTLYTVINNSKNDAVRNLKDVNDILTKQLSAEKLVNMEEIKKLREEHREELEAHRTEIEALKLAIEKISKAVEYERDQRIRAEDYIRTLTRILVDNKIPFPEFPKASQ